MLEFGEGLSLNKTITTEHIISNTTNSLGVKLNLNK